MNLVIGGMAEGYVLTRGLGDSSTEPAPEPPASGLLDVVLGQEAGGVYAMTNRAPHLAMRAPVPHRHTKEEES